MTDRLTTAGQAVVAAALAEWHRVVRDPCDRIDAYIRGDQGLAWPTADATFKSVTPYTRDGMFAWCGAFAAYCWGAAGLDRDIRHRHLASCNRLSRSPLDRVQLDELRPGDILVIGCPGDAAWGTHITIVERIDGGLAYTIEGNAIGQLGDGSIGEGVIRRTRPLSLASGGVCPVTRLPSLTPAVRAYRPRLEDLGEEDR